jgi:signal transduction histidine kinase
VLLAVALLYSAPVALVTAAVSVGTLLLLVPLSPVPGAALDDFVSSAIVVVVLVLLGYAFGSRGRAEQRAEQERAEKAALAERARVAREMHDVVAHHMSTVAVRCETAPYRITGLPDAGVREFAELGDAAREAITDMQRLLGVLRTAEQPSDLAPQPGLARIPELARRSAAAVTLDLPQIAVPESVALCAYRIVQEALTNAAKHVHGAAVSVRLRREGGALDVRVTNGPGGSSCGGGGGRGLVGMRKRVALHGGSLSARSTVDSGFEVRATLPVGAE